MPLDDERFAAILGDIACHGNVRQAVRAHKTSSRTFYERLAADEDSRERYQAAKSAGCAPMADEILRLQDEKPALIDTQFGKKVDPGWVQWQRNRIDVRKWLLSKLLPRTYGERTVIAGDADNPLAVEHDFADPKASLLRGIAPRTTDDGEGSSGSSTNG